MKTAFLLFTLLTFLTNKNDCERIRDCVYLVKHNIQNSAFDYILAINGEFYTIQVNDTLNEKGKVSWIGDCSLKLKPDVNKKQDTTDFAKKIYQSLGESFIEIKATSGDTTFFRNTWTGNLHITEGEGYFLKVK